MFKKDELKLLWPFYIAELLAGAFVVTAPVQIIFLLQRFSFAEISFAFALAGVVSIFFEVPGGAVADTYGRKFAVISGRILAGLLCAAIPFIHSPINLYAISCLGGAVGTLLTGADEAWMVDRLEHHGKQCLTHEMYTKIWSLRSAGFAIGSLFSSLLLFFVEMPTLFYIQGGGMVIASFFLATFAKEDNHHVLLKEERSIRTTVSTFKEGFAFTWRTTPLRYLLIAISCAYIPRSFALLAWQPVLADLSMPVQYLGIICTISSLLTMVIPFLSKIILKRIGSEKHYLAFVCVADFALLLSLYWVGKPFFLYGIIIIFLHECVVTLRIPVDSIFYQSFLTRQVRATAGSVQYMMLSIVSCLSMVSGGFLADLLGAKTMIILFAFFLIPASFFYLLAVKKPEASFSEVDRDTASSRSGRI